MPEIQTYSPILPTSRQPSLSERQRALAQALAQGETGRSGGGSLPAGNKGLALALGNALVSGAEGLAYKAQSDKEAAAQAASRGTFAHMVAGAPRGVSGGGNATTGASGGAAPSIGDGPGQGYAHSRADVVDMIRKSANAHGVDPDVAVKVALSEGLNVYTGDKGSSFGPFQLHYGGVAGGGNAVGGMGDDFTKRTGLDARDPSTVPQQIDFAMAQAARGGWGPWHGWKGDRMAGIGGPQVASADMPAPNARPVGGEGLPGDMMQAPQGETMPSPGGFGMALDVAENQKFGNPSLMGAPSPYGVIPPNTGDPAAQSLATALSAFNSLPTPAGIDTPNSGAALPSDETPSFQGGTTVGALPPSVRDASNSVADAQAAGQPSFTGLPETNGHRVALSNSPAFDVDPSSAPMPSPQMAADVPLPPVRPNQAMIDALGQPGPTDAGNSPSSAPDPTSTGSINMGGPPDVPARNAVPAMGQGIPPSALAAALSPVGKNANFETPQAFNLAQSGDNSAMVAALGSGASAMPSAPTQTGDGSASRGYAGPSPFRQIMDGGDIKQVAAQQYARVLGGEGPEVIPASAGAPPAAAPSYLQDAASILSDPYATPAMQAYAKDLLEKQTQAPAAWQHIERPDGSVVAFNPQTQELRQIAGPNSKPETAKVEAPKWQVIGEDQYGNKRYGYPPAPGDQPQASDQAAPSPDASLQGLSGQAMLDQLAKSDPSTASQVKAIVEGRAPYPTGLLLNKPFGQRLASLVTQADPTFETANAGARSHVRNDFTAGGAGSPAGQITAGNTAIQHLGHLADAAEALGNFDSGLPGNDLANTIGNKWQQFRGRGDRQAVFDNIAGKYVEEATKFYRGSGGTEADIQRDLGNISSSMSPTELRAAIKAQSELLQSKVNALQDRWHTGMGPLGGDFPIIQSESQAALDRIHGYEAGPNGAVAARAPSAGPPDAAASYLRQNPSLAQQFDAKYGPGAAARVLGQ